MKSRNKYATIVLDIKEFFDEWKEKHRDEMQSSESEEEQHRPLGWIAKDKQRFKEKLCAKTIELEKLELEIRNLNASLSLLKDFEIEELRKRLDVLMMDLRDKEDSLHKLEESNKRLIIKESKSNDELRCARKTLHKLEESNKRLIIKESKSNDELQYARKTLIDIIKEISTNDDHIGVKIMGEFNMKPFIDAMEKRYDKDEAEIIGPKLYSLWKENIKDPNWNPFKVVLVDGVAKQVIINDEDNKLNWLKKRIGNAAYNGVVAALIEKNENNSSGEYPILELWNYEKNMRATFDEGIQFLLNYQSNKRKRENEYHREIELHSSKRSQKGQLVVISDDDDDDDDDE
ncbi:unnamed protein product [Trifolium pratense]|uniref:Uncharacterized protein n=1 Tax=Trifolium pratense TaxID=57577 RepID=A0ACB0JBF7_TRIPR|nr:unnamed protein product [Trifolium pratense]